MVGRPSRPPLGVKALSRNGAALGIAAERRGVGAESPDPAVRRGNARELRWLLLVELADLEPKRRIHRPWKAWDRPELLVPLVPLLNVRPLKRLLGE